MARKMPGRLVALSASAVATIYFTGLFSTRPSLAGNAPATSTATDSTSTAPARTGTSTPQVVVGASATPTATAVPPTAVPSSSTYADGTYSATGTSNLGNVTVSVTIASDTITNVQITKVTTKYPVSRIASLPTQVISKQTANVNVVSGATYSSQAFRQAVQQALVQAQAAAA